MIPFLTLTRPGRNKTSRFLNDVLEQTWHVGDDDAGRFRRAYFRGMEPGIFIQSQARALFAKRDVVEGWFKWVEKDPLRRQFLAGWHRWTTVALKEDLEDEDWPLKACRSDPGLVCGATIDGMLIVHQPILCYGETITLENHKTAPQMQMGFVRIWPDQVSRE